MEKDKGLTSEEISERLEKRKNYVRKELPYLLQEAAYEKAKAEISKARYEQIHYAYATINLHQSSDKPDNNSVPDKEPVKS